MRTRAAVRTLIAIRDVVAAGPHDALLVAVEGFLDQLGGKAAGEPVGPSFEEPAAVIEAWMTQMVGPLLSRVERLLAMAGDLQAVREVLRALWVLLERHAGGARVELAEIGVLLSSSLEVGDHGAARRAVSAAQLWFERHQWAIATTMRHSFSRGQ